MKHFFKLLLKFGECTHILSLMCKVQTFKLSSENYQEIYQIFLVFNHEMIVHSDLVNVLSIILYVLLISIFTIASILTVFNYLFYIFMLMKNIVHLVYFLI